MQSTDQLFDVVIIGAGFAGAATAYALLRQAPLRVLLIEREKSFGVYASGKNAGMLRQAVECPETLRHIQTTKKFFQNLPSESPLFFPKGSLLLGTERKLKILQNHLTSVQVESSLFFKTHLPNFLPSDLMQYLQKARFEAALWTPDDGVVDIQAFLNYLIRQSERSGLVFYANTEVKALSFEDFFWKIRTPQGELRASVVVNAAGAWAEQIGCFAGSSKRDLIAWRRHLYVSEPVQMHVSSWPLVWNIEREVYFRPESDGLLFSPGDETRHPPQAPEISVEARQLLAQKLTENFPGLAELGIRRAWACLRTKCGTQPFVLEWDENLQNFFWVAGLGGHGMSSSIGIGGKAAERILEKKVAKRR